MHPFRILTLSAAVVGLSASCVLAQRPPGGGGPGGGGPGGGGAMGQWREAHKHTFALTTAVTRGLVACEETSATKLKQAQAKQLLAILSPLRKQPKLTQAQAQASLTKVKGVLSAQQKAALDKAVQAPPRGFGGGPGGGRPGGGPGAQGRRPGGGPGGGPGGPGGGRPGGGGPGGPGGGPGGGFQFDAAAMKDFNPFNPAKGGPMYERNQQRNERLFTFLTARAAGKEAKLEFPRGRGGPGGGPGGGRPGGQRASGR